jgi:hypothetical protein
MPNMINAEKRKIYGTQLPIFRISQSPERGKCVYYMV